MEAAIHFIRSELEETIKHRVEEVDVGEMLEDMHRRVIAEESDIVRKNGDLHFCVDYRKTERCHKERLFPTPSD
jgi:hypothetical protein